MCRHVPKVPYGSYAPAWRQNIGQLSRTSFTGEVDTIWYICVHLLYWIPPIVTQTQTQGWIQDFKLGGAHLKKIVGVFRVKNHDFMPNKSYFFKF